jgi:hypothetical protein
MVRHCHRQQLDGVIDSLAEFGKFDACFLRRASRNWYCGTLAVTRSPARSWTVTSGLPGSHLPASVWRL